MWFKSYIRLKIEILTAQQFSVVEVCDASKAENSYAAGFIQLLITFAVIII